MTASSIEPTSYDEVPYASYPYPRTHPDHLATLATLFGLDPPATDTARVLELGCAAGGNLIPMAECLPRARLLGIDLSARQVSEGQSVIRALGLANIELRQGDLARYEPEPGSFDYILCHGVYSWVSPEAQRAVLETGRRALAPQGVMYVSYNAYPGWHLRGTVREMMKYHADRHEDAGTRIEQSRALLDFLISATGQSQGAYGQLLRDELEILRRHEDAYLFHEHLEETNQPLYFHEFAERAQSAGLRYLCEAQFSEMVPSVFGSEVEATLRRIAPDIIQMEQYLDFLKNRMFRRTLLCRAEVQPERRVTSQRLIGLRGATPLDPAGDEPNAEGDWIFRSPQGGGLAVSSHTQRQLLLKLREAWPGSVALDDLVSATIRAAESEGHEAVAAVELRNFLLRLYTADLVELRRPADRFTTAVSQRPRAGLLARLQALGSPLVTNGRHESVRLGSVDSHLLALLDGTRDAGHLVAELAALVESGQLRLEEDEQVISDRRAATQLLQHALPALLERLARLALLVG